MAEAWACLCGRAFAMHATRQWRHCSCARQTPLPGNLPSPPTSLPGKLPSPAGFPPRLASLPRSLQVPLFHRINARTFRLHLAGGAAQAVLGAAADGAADGTRHDNSDGTGGGAGGSGGSSGGVGGSGGGGGGGSESSALLLLFPASMPDHDVNTCAAVLSDLAAGRGVAEPAGRSAGGRVRRPVQGVGGRRCWLPAWQDVCVCN